MTQTRYPRCTCGHSRTAHASCTWKPHERGECKKLISPDVVIVELDGSETHLADYPCSCTQYTPKAS